MTYEERIYIITQDRMHILPCREIRISGQTKIVAVYSDRVVAVLGEYPGQHAGMEVLTNLVDEINASHYQKIYKMPKRMA